MKTLCLVLVATVLAAVTGLSFWSSWGAEAAHQAMMDGLAQQPDVRVLGTSFERGWLRSEAESSFELHGPVGEGLEQWLEARGGEDVRPRLGLRVSHTMEHGALPMLSWVSSGASGAPVVARVTTRVEFDHETQSEFAKIFGKLPPVDLVTDFRASGSGHSEIQIPSQSWGGDDAGFHATWRGLTGDLDFDRDFGSVRGGFQAPGFELSAGDVRVTFSALESKLDLQHVDEGLPTGTASYRIAELRVSGDDPHNGKTGAMVCSDCSIEQVAMIRDGRFEAELKLHTQQLEVDGGTYGPAELEFALRGVDAEALVELRRISGKLQSGSEDLAQTAALAQEMMGLLPALVAGSPEMEISRASLATQDGEVWGKVRVSIDGSQPQMLSNPLMLPMLLSAELDMELPAAFLEPRVQDMAREMVAAQLAAGMLPPETDLDRLAAAQGMEQLKRLRSEGIILLDGESYRTKLRWDGGQLRVNGIPMNPSSLMTAAQPAAESQEPSLPPGMLFPSAQPPAHPAF